jgi:hypothetical protein
VLANALTLTNTLAPPTHPTTTANHHSKKTNTNDHSPKKTNQQTTPPPQNNHTHKQTKTNQQKKQNKTNTNINNSAWTDIHPSQLLGPPAVFKKYDLLKVTVDELQAGISERFEMAVAADGPVDAFTGWFDVQFKGSPENPADADVVLSTAPDPTGATHWGQQTFYASPAVQAAAGDTLAATITVGRRADNHRLLQVGLGVQVNGPSAAAAQSQKPREFMFQIE